LDFDLAKVVAGDGVDCCGVLLQSLMTHVELRVVRLLF